MGIQVEFNPDLCLRNIREFSLKRGRRIEEFIPPEIKAGDIFRFYKNGQRNYWLNGEIPLRETQGEGRLGRPIASVRILETTHSLDDYGQVCTQGSYLVKEVFDPADPTPKFECFDRRK